MDVRFNPPYSAAMALSKPPCHSPVGKVSFGLSEGMPRKKPSRKRTVSPRRVWRPLPQQVVQGRAHVVSQQAGYESAVSSRLVILEREKHCLALNKDQVLEKDRNFGHKAMQADAERQVSDDIGAMRPISLNELARRYTVAIQSKPAVKGPLDPVAYEEQMFVFRKLAVLHEMKGNYPMARCLYLFQRDLYDHRYWQPSPEGFTLWMKDKLANIQLPEPVLADWHALESRIRGESSFTTREVSGPVQTDESQVEAEKNSPRSSSASEFLRLLERLEQALPQTLTPDNTTYVRRSTRGQSTYRIRPNEPQGGDYVLLIEDYDQFAKPASLTSPRGNTLSIDPVSSIPVTYQGSSGTDGSCNAEVIRAVGDLLLRLEKQALALGLEPLTIESPAGPDCSLRDPTEPLTF